ncbi:DUF6982 domain-containing protein [Terriglobus tenax]|uniref:DUF6982 domain-containing protein n=1 Tax=Terriglobus tenax TaxID=1111115 RepID=UPI0021DFAC89|nr:hypothetical protein [Terriglobus tenax]
MPYMSAGRKKVLVRRFSRDTLAGYLPSSGFVQQAALELLDLSGRVTPVPMAEVKMVLYVRDFNLNDRDPERNLRKTFLAKPRTEGLFLRLKLRDEDILEGLAPLDLSLLDTAVEDQGIQFTPPDVRSNVQRIFVPRSAIESMDLLAVVTTPSKKKPVVPAPEKSLQEQLFASEPPPNSRPN